MVGGPATFDALLSLRAVGDGNETSSGDETLIVDVGAGEVRGDWVVEVTNIDFTTGDEVYRIILEGSNSATFASGVEPLAEVQLADATAYVGNGDVDGAAGRYVCGISNKRRDTVYRYLRVTNVLGGTTPIIDYVSFLSKLGSAAG